MPNIIKQSFNSGELTPKIDTRSDVDKYGAGCRIVENMLPLKYGCVERRTGTEFVIPSLLSPQGVKLVPFIYSSTIAYDVEFGEQYARFFYDGVLIEGADIETPYLVDELFEIQFHQIGDTIRITHRNHFPRILTRTSTTTFSLALDPIEGGPFLTRNDIANDDGISLQASVTTLAAAGTLTATSAVFENEHTGALFEVAYPKDAIIDTAGVGATSTGIEVKGTLTFTTRGTWTGTVILERKDGDSAWEGFKTYRSNNDQNITLSYKEKNDNIQYRINASGTSGTFNGEIIIDETLQTAIYRIDAVTSPTLAQVTVMKAAPAVNGLNTNSLRWAEGAWSGVRGYPSCVGSMDERVIYGATNHQISTFWLSKIGDYSYFGVGVEDSDSFSLTMTTQDEMMWINVLDGIVLGTTGGVWCCRSNKIGTPITATNYNLREYSAFGSAMIQSLKVGNAILYVDNAKRKIREFTFGQSNDEYESIDLNALADHITKGLISGFAFQKHPDPIIWVTLEDGGIRSMTYERNQDVVAWARHPLGITNGLFNVYPTLRDADPTTIPTQPEMIAEIELSGETEISDADGLQTITGSGHYSLIADIDLTNYPWTPISTFSGVLEGNSHKIKGLKINTPENMYSAMFEELTGDAQIRNLILENASVIGEQYASVLVGIIVNQTGNILIHNVHVVNSAIGPNVSANDMSESGFIVGGIESANAYIYDCTVNGSSIDGIYSNDSTRQLGQTDIGGLVGAIDIPYTYNDRKVYICNCQVNQGTMSGQIYVGGFIGRISVESDRNIVVIDNCSSTANVESAGEFIGGFIGLGPSVSTVSSRQCIYNYVQFSNCFASGQIEVDTTTDGQFVGGFSGYIEGGGSSLGCQFNTILIMTCWATGNIVCNSKEDSEFIGGFCGFLESHSRSALRVTDCYATGNISITDRDVDALDIQYVGGFAGHIKGEDVVKWWEDSGRLIWYSSGLKDLLISLPQLGVYWYDIYLIPDLEPRAEKIGDSSTVVKNCYSTGNLFLNQLGYMDIYFCGGFTGGITNATVVYCHSDGNVTCYATSPQNDYNDIFGIGGFAGYSEEQASIYACSAIGNISAISIGNEEHILQGVPHPTLGWVWGIGGFIGEALDTTRINDCYAWGNIITRTLWVDASVAIHTAEGKIYDVGGFVGLAGDVSDYVQIRNVYSIGTISTQMQPYQIARSGYGIPYNTGGLIGLLYAGNEQRTYWDYEASQQLSSDGGVALTTELAQTEESYVLWDFDIVWKMKDFGTSSISITPSAEGEDRIMLALSRIIQNEQVRYIERMRPRAYQDQRYCYFLDCGKTYVGAETDTITGLEFIEDETVKVLGDGAYVGEFVVSQGTVILPDSYSRIAVGLPYRYRVQPMRFDSDGSLGSIRKINELVISFMDTLNAKYGVKDGLVYDIDWRTEEPYTTPPKLFTGDKIVTYDGGFSIEDPIIIEGDDPFPCTVRAIVVRVEKTGR